MESDFFSALVNTAFQGVLSNDKSVICLPRQYAERFGIFNSNHRTANPRYSCVAVNGDYSGILLAQGCSSAGDIYAKQFAEEGNLKGIGDWYRSVGAQVGGEVRVTFTSPNSLEIEYLG